MFCATVKLKVVSLCLLALEMKIIVQSHLSGQDDFYVPKEVENVREKVKEMFFPDESLSDKRNGYKKHTTFC